MGLRIQAYFLGVVLTFFSAFAAALGVGEISINSTLNQPLDARIELLQVRSLSEQDLAIDLASPEAFERAGVERNFFLTDLQFDIDLNNPAGPSVLVTSEKPVREPFLNFIVEVRWPSGRLLREYTILVDLPVFSGEQARPVQAAPVSTQPREQQSQPSQQPAARPAQQRPATSSSSRPASQYSGEQYGPVKPSETLWEIAAKVRPDQSASMQQTMIALQRMNPDAFINDNINLLRRGQILRVPTLDDISQLSTRDAIREVSTQNQNWNNRGEDFSDGAQLEGSKNYTPTRTTSTEPEGRVKLSSSDSGSGSDAGSSQGEDGSGTAAIAAELSATQEQLDASRRENSELRDRLRAMEEQVKTMEKLLEVSSEEMRALELAAAQTNEAAEQEPAEPVDTAQPEAPAEEPVSEVSQPEVTQDPVDAEPEVAEETAPEESQPTQTPEPQKGIADLLMENILYVAIGLGALVLAVIGFILMRKNRDDGFEDEAYDEFEPTYESVEPALDADAEDNGDSVVAPVEQDQEDEVLQDEDVVNEAETEDVVAECDIHIAYGQYDQAEEKLARALEREPRNPEIRLKLLEVYAAQNALSDFDNQYAKLIAVGDQPSIERAALLRESIDGLTPFDESAYDVTAFKESISGGTPDADATVPAFDSSDEQIDSEDLGDDTLSFDIDDVDDLTVSEPKASDADEFAVESEPEDITLIKSPPDMAEPERGEVGSDLDTTDDLADLQESLEGEDNREAEFETDLADSGSPADDNLDDLEFNLDDDEFDLEIDDSELQIEGDDFELDESFAGLSEEPSGETDSEPLSGEDEPEEGYLTSDDDVTQVRSDLAAEDSDPFIEPDTDTSAAETAEEPVASDLDELDLTAQANELDLDSDATPEAPLEGFSEAPLMEDDTAEVAPPDAADEQVDPAEVAESEDLSFDEPLDSVLDKEDRDSDDRGSLAENFAAEAGEEPYNLEEFDESAEKLSTNEMSEPDLSFEEDVLPVEEPESAPEEATSEPAALEDDLLAAEEAQEKDFEEEIDVDSDINLDSLDQELDELASGFSGDTDALDEPDQESHSPAAEEKGAPEAASEFDFSDPSDFLSEDDFNLDSEEPLEGEESDALKALKESKSQEEAPADVAQVDYSGDQAKDSDVEQDEQQLDAAISSMDFEIPDFDPEEDDDSNLGFLSDSDEIATKLDLARAYIDMGDADGAKDILDEIMDEGNDDQKREAETLLAKLG